MSDIEKKEDSADSGLKPVASFTKDNIGTDEVITSYTSNGHVVKVTGDVDEAMKVAMTNESESFGYDPVADKKLLHKIDLYTLPLFCLLYATQFMDKTSISSAAVIGLKTYYGMEGTMYSWCGSAFYLGYLVFEFPASALLQRFPLAKTTGAFIILWGFILCMHAVAKNYAGFVALRTILGMFESAITPAMVIITSQWYRKEEQFLRTSVWFACNGLGTIIGGAIGYGVVEHDAGYSIEGFKVLFLAMGCMTIAIGVFFIFYIPDDPSKCWWLSDVEKKMVVERIRTNEQGFGNKHFKKYQFFEALRDLNTWLFFLFAIASNIPNGALTNFGSILLNSDFGYTAKETMLMNMPCGAVEFVGCILMAWCVGFIKHRLIVSAIAMVITIICSCLLAFPSSKTARLVGYYLQYVYPLTTITCLSLFSSNVAGHTKKITVNAIFLIGYCVGNLVGPQTFISKQAPSYTGGKISFVICDVVTLILILMIYANYIWMNKKKEKERKTNAEALEAVHTLENHEFADLTDFENPYFRYEL